MKYFKTWLIDNYLKVDNYLGDLAKDIKYDKDFPRTNDENKIYDYLKKVELVKSALILLKKLIRCTIQSNKKALNQ